MNNHASPTVARLDSLTGLRAAAALAVFMGHFAARLQGDPERAVSLIASQGGMAVTFFFILSGFVMTWSHRPTDTPRAFWRRRFARIYPAYAVTMLAGLGLAVVQGGSSGLLGPLLANATMVQAWVPDSSYYFGMNGVGWSLSVEAFFYLAFPLVIPAIVRLSAKGLIRVQVALLIAVVLIAIAGDLIGGDVGSWMSGKLPLARIHEFLLGCSVALQLLRGSLPRVPWTATAVFVLALSIALGQLPTTYTNTAAMIVPFAALLVAAAQRDISGKPTAFSGRRMVWLGEISFCFYLVHQMVTRVLGVLGDTDTWVGASWRFILALAVSTLAAWALHAWVEKPFERRLRGGKRSPAGTKIASAA